MKLDYRSLGTDKRRREARWWDYAIVVAVLLIILPMIAKVIANLVEPP